MKKSLSVLALSLLGACSLHDPLGFGESVGQTSQTDNGVTAKLPHALGGGTGIAHYASFDAPKKKYPLGLQQSSERRPAHANGDVKPNSLPATVDLSQGAPTPGDQGQTGSCATWSTGYSAMGWWDARSSLGGAPYAPMFIYAQVVQGNCMAGTSIEGDLDIIQSQGIDTAADYEPMEQDLDCATQPTSENLAVAAHYKISNYENPDLSDPKTAIMTELAQGRPVMLGIEVYDNLFNADAQNYLVGPPPAGTQSEGGHAITGFKYDDNGVWILNSWGTSWGVNGWAELTWDFIQSQNCLDDVVAITGVVGGNTPQPPQPPPSGDAGAGDASPPPPVQDDAGPTPPPSNGGPQLAWVSPSDGDTISPGAPMSIIVDASDPDAQITDVQLQWGYPAGTTTYEMSDMGNGTAEVDLTLSSSAQPGPRTLTVTATDSQGQLSQIQETIQVQ